MKPSQFQKTLDTYEGSGNEEFQNNLNDMTTEDLYSQDAAQRGLLTRDGYASEAGLSTRLNQPQQKLIDEGVIADSDNVGKAFIDGVSRTLQEAGKGFALTLGEDDVAKSIERRLAMNGELRAASWSDSKLNWIADGLGSGVVDIVGAAGASAVAGGPIGGAAYTFGRMFGETKQHIEEIAPDLSPYQQTGTAIALTAFMSGIEMSFGLESRVGGMLRGNRVGTKSVGKFLRSKEGHSFVRRSASEFFDPTNPLTGFIAGGVGETLEESAQAGSEMFTDYMLTGEAPDAETLKQRLLVDPLRALPAGAVFGAFSYSRTQATEMSTPKPVTEEAVQEMHTKVDEETGQVVVDEESLQKETEAFDQLTKDLNHLPNVKEAGKAVETIKAFSYMAAKADRARGIDSKPTDFIKEWQTLFVDVDATGSDFSVINNIINDQQKDPQEKSTQILEYLGNKFGNKSRVYQQIKNVQQELEASMIEQNMAQTFIMLEQAAPELVDKEAKAFIQTQVKGLVSQINTKEIKTALDEGNLQAIDVATLSVDTLTPELYARLLVDPQTVKIGKNTYQIGANNGYVTIQLQKAAEQETTEETTRRAEAEAERRQKRTESRGAKSVKEVTGGDIRLAEAKARATEAMAKAAELTNQLDTFKKRIGTRGGQPQFSVPLPRGIDTLQTAEESTQELLTEEQKAQLDEEELGFFQRIRQKLFPNTAISPEIERNSAVKQRENMVQMEALVEIITGKAWDSTVDPAPALTDDQNKLLVALMGDLGKEMRDIIQQFERDESKVPNASEMIWDFGEDHDLNPRNIQEFITNIKAMKESGQLQNIFTDKHGQGVLPQKVDVQMNGLYMAPYRTAVFFRNADEVTVIHEFLHHARTMLAPDLQAEILNAFGNDYEKTNAVWTSHAEEKFVDVMLGYLREGALPARSSTKIAEAMDAMAGTLKRVTELKDGDLNDEAKAIFKTLFEDVETTDIHGINAESAVASMVQDAPTSDQVLESGVSAELIGKDTTETRHNVYTLFGGKFGKQLKASKMTPKELLHQVAIDTIAGYTETSEVSDLTQEELKRCVIATDTATKKPHVVTAEEQNVVDWETQHAQDNPLQKIKTSTRIKERTQGFMNWASNLGTAAEIKFKSIENLCVMLDRGATYGPWHQMLGDRHQELQHDAADLDRKAHAKMFKFAGGHQGVFKLTKASERRVDLAGFAHNGSEAVHLDMAQKAAKAGDTRAKQTISESNNITEEEFEAASKLVAGDKDLQALEAYLTATYDMAFETVAPVVEQATGKPLKRRPFYFTIAHNNGAFSEFDDVAQALSVVGNKGEQQRSKVLAAQKELSGTRGGQVRIDDALSTLNQYIRHATNYAAKAMTVKEVGESLNSAAVEEALVNSYGATKGQAIIEQVQELWAGEMYTNGKLSTPTAYDNALSYARQATTFSMLGLRMSVMMAQPVSYLTALANMKGALTPKGVGIQLRNFGEMTKAIQSNMFENEKRALSGRYKKEGYVHWLDGTSLYWKDANGVEHGLWVDHAQQILNSITNPETVDLKTQNVPALMKKKVFNKSLGDWVLEGVTMFDMVTVATVWKTEYDLVYANEMKKHNDPVKAEKRAAREANRTIVSTQPQRTIFEKSAAVREGEFVRSMLMFQTQPMQNWNQFLDTVARPAIDAVRTGNWKGLAGLAPVQGQGEYDARFPQRVAMGLIIPAVLMGMRARRREPTEEEVMKDIMFYPISQLPAVGGTINALFAQDMEFAEMESAYARMVNGSLKLVYGTAKVVAGKGNELNSQDLRQMTNSGLNILALPTVMTDIVPEIVNMATDPDYELNEDTVRNLTSLRERKLPEE